MAMGRMKKLKCASAVATEWVVVAGIPYSLGGSACTTPRVYSIIWVTCVTGRTSGAVGIGSA